MSALAHQVEPAESETLFIGKIPVRNLWLLMFYASGLYRQLGSAKIAVEDNPEDIADLVAKILCRQVERRLRRNLSFAYESKVAVIRRVRGRIDSLYTERHRLLDKGQVCCRFDKLTVDTPKNRYVRAALEQLNKLVKEKKLARRCRTLAMNLDRLGVNRGKPLDYNGKSECFGHHNAKDQKMIAAADLAFALALPTEFAGQHHLVMPDKAFKRLGKLFEKAIAGFYSVALEKSEWNIQAGRRLKWQGITYDSAGSKSIMPNMQTDIMIDKKSSNKRLVIDTKFNSVISKNQLDNDILKSAYIYQMYAYLRSQEEDNWPLSLFTTGMLLHPSIDIEVDEQVTIQRHPIRFCTVNLGLEVKGIRERLLYLHSSSFNK